MDVLIESTKRFEKDLDKLSQENRLIAVEKINEYVNLFQTQKPNFYSKLCSHPLQLDLNGYQSSLYVLKISQQFRVILAVDEDPIFGQVIFTLFRLVKEDNLGRAYRGIAESLYQELRHTEQEPVQA